jgi:DNA polymerase delta subunit 1
MEGKEPVTLDMDRIKFMKGMLDEKKKTELPITNSITPSNNNHEKAIESGIDYFCKEIEKANAPKDESLFDIGADEETTKQNIEPIKATNKRPRDENNVDESNDNNNANDNRLRGNYIRKRTPYDPKKKFEIPHNIIKAFGRPELPCDYYKNDITLQLLDVQYKTDKIYSQKQKITRNGNVPVIKLYGVDENGHSIAVNVLNFLPYFYIKPRMRVDLTNQLDSFRKTLNAFCRNSKDVSNSGHTEFVLEIEPISSQSLMGFSDTQETFYKITLCEPNYVSSLRDALSIGMRFAGIGDVAFDTFESNILFVMRFLCDTGIFPSGWITIPSNKIEITPKSLRNTKSQVEVYTSWEDIIYNGCEGIWKKMAPIRRLGFDTEWAGQKGKFPNALEDPLIQISGILSTLGVAEMKKMIMTYRACSPVIGAYAICFKEEKDMFCTWKDFVNLVDPDIITGHNIEGFDFLYMKKRSEHLGLGRFMEQSRDIGYLCDFNEKGFTSKQSGAYGASELRCPGRFIMDLLRLVPKERKLRSYKLNNIAAILLGDQKEDLPHSLITPMWNGTKANRTRLAVYCLKDSYLTIAILDKLVLTHNYFEMARATGVTVGTLIFSGQMAKMMSLIYRKCKIRNYMVPYYKYDPNDEEEDLEGAVVIEPKKGFYKDPVPTLDFTSLCKYVHMMQ